MCTAATFQSKDFYFGRNLDYERSYGEEVVIVPRGYPMKFRYLPARENYAIIGMAHVENDYPLFYDAMNEHGLCLAGLNFVGNAYYPDCQKGKENVAQYEFICYVLRNFASVDEFLSSSKELVITNTPFDSRFPPSQLHYLLADKNDCIVIEQGKDGMHIYHNPVGVLTNNPPFDKMLFNLRNYRHLSNEDKGNSFLKNVPLEAYSRGMGAIGLPGDLSSMSRFVKVAFVRNNSVCEKDEVSSVSQFFHILESVEQQKGCCKLGEDSYEITLYSSCMNADQKIYYYRTYDNRHIHAIHMDRADLDSKNLYRYPLIEKEVFENQN